MTPFEIIFGHDAEELTEYLWLLVAPAVFILIKLISRPHPEQGKFPNPTEVEAATKPVVEELRQEAPALKQQINETLETTDDPETQQKLQKQLKELKKTSTNTKAPGTTSTASKPQTNKHSTAPTPPATPSSTPATTSTKSATR
ncbi:hypothetical protein [Salinactinospora qingdaonensis]|uniref:Sec-independent protein translocase protein TatB n=1 Tax=Salinactinospora qingdaonensis TaxID=702744 RepID=A0ABP7F882_9ACTN